jgi:hypothetical protein
MIICLGGSGSSTVGHEYINKLVIEFDHLYTMSIRINKARGEVSFYSMLAHLFVII